MTLQWPPHYRQGETGLCSQVGLSLGSQYGLNWGHADLNSGVNLKGSIIL